MIETTTSEQSDNSQVADVATPRPLLPEIDYGFLACGAENRLLFRQQVKDGLKKLNKLLQHPDNVTTYADNFDELTTKIMALQHLYHNVYSWKDDHLNFDKIFSVTPVKFEPATYRKAGANVRMLGQDSYLWPTIRKTSITHREGYHSWGKKYPIYHKASHCHVVRSFVQLLEQDCKVKLLVVAIHDKNIFINHLNPLTIEDITDSLVVRLLSGRPPKEFFNLKIEYTK